jgi:hypothetical protein
LTSIEPELLATHATSTEDVYESASISHWKSICHILCLAKVVTSKYLLGKYNLVPPTVLSVGTDFKGICVKILQIKKFTGNDIRFRYRGILTCTALRVGLDSIKWQQMEKSRRLHLGCGHTDGIESSRVESDLAKADPQLLSTRLASLLDSPNAVRHGYGGTHSMQNKLACLCGFLLSQTWFDWSKSKFNLKCLQFSKTGARDQIQYFFYLQQLTIL